MLIELRSAMIEIKLSKHFLIGAAEEFADITLNTLFIRQNEL